MRGDYIQKSKIRQEDRLGTMEMSRLQRFKRSLTKIHLIFNCLIHLIKIRNHNDKIELF